MKKLVIASALAVFAFSAMAFASAPASSGAEPQDMVSMVKKGSHQIKRGTKVVYHRTKRGGKWVYHKGHRGGAYVFHKVKRGGKWTYVKTRNFLVGKPKRRNM